MAGVLAGGEGAVACSWSAGARWEIAEDDPREVHVAVERRLRSRPGLRFHTLPLSPAMTTARRGIAVLTPAHTLVDLASVMTPTRLQRAVHEAEVRRLCRPSQLRAALELRGRTRGSGALRAILDMADGRALPTRSEFEDRFLRCLKRHGLPLPRTNARVRTPRGIYEVDCLWSAARVVVELDGARYHSGAYAQRRDARKDRALKAAGLDVTHVTWLDLSDGEGELIADLRPLISRVCA